MIKLSINERLKGKKLFMEVWKPIEDYENLYEVSNLGRVKSLKYGKEKILKPRKNSCGYLMVTLCKKKIIIIIIKHFLFID